MMDIAGVVACRSVMLLCNQLVLLKQVVAV